MLLIEIIAAIILSLFRMIVVFITGRACFRCEHWQEAGRGKFYCHADREKCEKHILKPCFKRERLRDLL